jgi:hypothetical protein
MSVLIHAHGFDLSDSLKEACEREVKNRMEPLIYSPIQARWNLCRDGHDWIAFLSWHERRQYHGNVRIRSDDMYKSISLAGKVAANQLNHQHHKVNDHHQQMKSKQRRPASGLDPIPDEEELL